MQAKGVKELVQREPWRSGQMRSRENLVRCHGQVEWDKDDPRWWWCRACGYCGHGTHVDHYAPNVPEAVYKERLEAFYHQKMWQGLTTEQARQQAYHLLAAVLKKATMLQPDELGKFINETLAG